MRRLLIFLFSSLLLLSSCSIITGPCSADLLAGFLTVEEGGFNLADQSLELIQLQAELNGEFFEEGQWVISKKNYSGCTIAYSYRLNGQKVMAPIFFVDIETRSIHPEDEMARTIPLLLGKIAPWGPIPLLNIREDESTTDILSQEMNSPATESLVERHIYSKDDLGGLVIKQHNLGADWEEVRRTSFTSNDDRGVLQFLCSEVDHTELGEQIIGFLDSSEYSGLVQVITLYNSSEDAIQAIMTRREVGKSCTEWDEITADGSISHWYQGQLNPLDRRGYYGLEITASNDTADGVMSRHRRYIQIGNVVVFFEHFSYSDIEKDFLNRLVDVVIDKCLSAE